MRAIRRFVFLLAIGITSSYYMIGLYAVYTYHEVVVADLSNL